MLKMQKKGIFFFQKNTLNVNMKKAEFIDHY